MTTKPADPRTAVRPARRGLRPARRTGLGLALAVVLSAILGTAIARHDAVQSFRIVETSMVPTLRDGERVLVDRDAYRTRTPERGDVVVFRVPEDPERYFVKRIVGLPGDTVERHDGRLVVAGREFEAHERAPRDVAPTAIPASTRPSHGDRNDDRPRPFANARSMPVAATVRHVGVVPVVKRIPNEHYFVVGDNVDQSFDSRHFGCISKCDLVGPVTHRLGLWSQRRRLNFTPR